MGALGKIFGFGDSLKRRLRDAVSNPSDYAEMTADQNQNEWNRNPDERSMGFFNPSPLGTMGNFQLRKELVDALPNLSRRDFMKKSAGIAGGTAAMSIPGAKLLQKFAPEERAVVKEIATEAAPKYKYNSLKEYLDDVHGETRMRMFDDFDPPTTGYHAAEDVPQALREWDEGFKSRMRDRLLRDEARYKEHNNLSKGVQFTEEGHPVLIFDEKVIRRPLSWDEISNANKTIMEFSPQAKKEMKEFKSLTKQIDTDYTGSHDWTQWAIKNSEDPTKIVEELKKWYIP